MRIPTFTINNVNRRLPILLEWREASKPDIVRQQERSTEAGFPADVVKRRQHDL